ncbi:MAG TPA: hypothetical protein VM866_10905 [Pyrinomonadaceae bacterium]|nr:hypothetical protein [Pyrinomonadaceae bacterium]
MKIKALTVCALLFVATTNPALLLAQGTPETRVGAWADVQKIPPGDELEVKLKNGRTVKGRVSTTTDTKLGLVRDGKTTDIDRAEVFRIKLVVAKSTAKSTLIGAGTGAGAGAAVAAILLAADEGDSGDGGVQAAVVTGFALIGTGIGALVGAGIGLRKRRVVIYEAKL